MKKIFSILVVAFFLAATFVLVPQNNYLAFAQEDEDQESEDTDIGTFHGKARLQEQVTQRYCQSGCPLSSRCYNGTCVPATNYPSAPRPCTTDFNCGRFDVCRNRVCSRLLIPCTSNSNCSALCNGTCVVLTIVPLPSTPTCNSANCSSSQCYNTNNGNCVTTCPSGTTCFTTSHGDCICR